MKHGHVVVVVAAAAAAVVAAAAVHVLCRRCAGFDPNPGCGGLEQLPQVWGGQFVHLGQVGGGRGGASKEVPNDMQGKDGEFATFK